jgi:hypothetical protein
MTFIIYSEGEAFEFVLQKYIVMAGDHFNDRDVVQYFQPAATVGNQRQLFRIYYQGGQ